MTARTIQGSILTDPNTPSITFPVSIVSTGTIDFGATSTTASFEPPNASLAVATFTIQPQATATGSSYVVSLINSGVTSTTSNCVSPADFGDNAITASFTFNKFVAPPPSATIAVSPASVTDSGAPLTFTATLSSAAAAPITINLTSGVTGTMTGVTNGCSAGITINTGATTGTCQISASNTVVGDGPGTATATIIAGTGYTIGATATASAQITNDDVAGISVAVAPSTVTENSGTPLVFTFTTTSQSGTNTTVNFTPIASTARYTSTCNTGSVVILANTSSITCSVTPIDDALLNGTANVSTTIQAGSYTIGAPSSAAATITDNEIGVSVVAAGGGSTTEGGSVSFDLTCTGTGSAIANYTFSGSYSPLPADGNILVTCGSIATVVVPTTDDSVSNGSRTLVLTITSLSQPTTGVVLDPNAASATASVLDNDAPKIIPTMSTLGLSLLGLLMAGFAGFAVQRRRV